MSDKDFKVKNKLVVNGLTGGAGPLVANSNKEIDSAAFLTTLQGGTGTTTSPSAGQVLYSAGGTTYNPTALNTLDVKGATYSADAPSSPAVGQIWVESDVNSDTFDPNIIRRKSFTATAAQTVFTTDFVFVDAYEQVFFNGMLLLRNSDYTTNGAASTVTLTSGAAVGDIVEVVTVTNLNSINTATTTTNTFTGIQTIKTTVNATNSNFKIISDGTADSLELFRATSPGVLTRSYNGTYDSPTAGTINQRTGFIIASSYDGSVYSNNSAVSMWNAENTTPTARGSYIIFETTAIGAASRSERMRIDSSGNLGIGSVSPANTRLYVYNSDASNPVQSVLHNANAGGSRYLILGSSGATAGALTWDNNNGRLSLDSLTTAPLLFRTNNTTAMWIDTSQNVGIGTISPTSRIHINGSTTTNVPLLRISHTNAPAIFNWSASMINGVMTAGTNNIIIIGQEESSRNCGYVGYRYVGPNSTQNAMTFGLFAVDNVVNIDGNGYLLAGYLTSNGAYKLQVNSQIFATSSSIATSDGRYKENVDTITGGLDIVDSLRPVSFTWKDHPVHNFVAGKTVGFIAQEVKDSLSQYDWVDNIIKTNTSDAILDEEGNEITPAEEFLGIAESNIIPLLVAAVKELKARVETLEAN